MTRCDCSVSATTPLKSPGSLTCANPAAGLRASAKILASKTLSTAVALADVGDRVALHCGSLEAGETLSTGVVGCAGLGGKMGNVVAEATPF